MGLPFVALLLTLGPVTLFVGRVLLAHGSALLAAELPATANLTLPPLLTAPWLALPLLVPSQLARLVALPLLAVLRAAPRVGLLDLLATPLLSSPLLAALRLGPPALLQAVPVPAGLRLAGPELALHALPLSTVLGAALRHATVVLLATLLRWCPLQASLCAATGPSLLPSALLALLSSALLSLPLSSSLALALLPSIALLAVALLALSLSTLLSPLAALPLVRLLALPRALVGIVLVGRLATPLSVSLPGGLELAPTLGASPSTLPLAPELGLPALLGSAVLLRPAGVFAASIPALAPVVPFALSTSVVPFALFPSVLGAQVAVTHGSG